MSNLIPPLLSSSPPPILGPLDEDDDDEFGDFRAANESYECDDLSLPSSPKKSPTKEVKSVFSCDVDINSNTSKQKIEDELKLSDNVAVENLEKDFQDRRKEGEQTEIGSENQVNCSSLLNNSEKDRDDPTPQISTDCEEDKEVIIPTTHEETEPSNLAVTPPINEDGKLDPLDDSPEFCEQRPATPAENGDNSEQEDEASKSGTDFSPNEVESIGEPSKSEDLSELDQNLEIKYDESPPDSKTEDLPIQDDDFGDFENHLSANFQQENEQRDDFGDLASAPEPQDIPVEAFKAPPTKSDDLSDDFGDFESSTVPDTVKPLSEIGNDDDDDEFGEFGDFSTHADFGSDTTGDQISMLTADITDASSKSEAVLKEIFPPVLEEVEDFRYIDETQQNVIFNALKDITDTDALSYQWSKSTGQKLLLKALNIDLRNILYGPSWNSSMPRFAANLGMAPLEPVKSEILTPTPVQNVASPSISSQKSQPNGDVPQAQFDWSGSGLINPLDSTSSSSAVVSEEPTQMKPDKNDVFLVPDKVQSNPIFRRKDPDTESVQNLDLSKTPTFVVEGRKREFPSPKMIPLRETHISNDINVEEKPNWFESTILTPELPRKKAILPEEDDDFDDFQMVLPSKPSPPDVINNKPNSEVFQFGKAPPVVEEDEFTDFRSAPAPVSLRPSIAQPLQPIRFEPLKPAVQYQTPNRINWPDPGVTEDDIRNIELTYSAKRRPADEDEWSDFVSVNQVSTKSWPVMQERTATPDLPLSVLNLNHIQPAKQPIPLVTPSGLSMQTKLTGPKQATRNVQPNLFRPPPAQFLPSLISQQFADSNNFQQFGGFSANNFPNFVQQNRPMTSAAINHHNKSLGEDDEDWSDFVSSQPPASQNLNGFNAQKAIDWNSTNIITNPSHFDSFQSYVPPQQQQQLNQQKSNKGSNNGASSRMTNTVPSISSMPELDFIAPKNRTNKK